MCLTVGEQPVNDQTDDREQEYANTPSELVCDRTIGFEDLDEDNDIEDQDNETDDSSTGTILP